MYTTQTEFDREIAGEFRDTDLYIYEYPIKSMGFKFIIHLISVNNTENQFIIYTHEPEYIQEELETYIQNTQTADYNTALVEENISINPSETITETIQSQSDSIFVIHSWERFQEDIDISRLNKLLDENTNSMWVCPYNSEPVDEKIYMYSDAIFEYKSQFNNAEYNQEIHVKKHFNGSENLKKVDLKFKPQLMIDTSQLT